MTNKQKVINKCPGAKLFKVADVYYIIDKEQSTIGRGEKTSDKAWAQANELLIYRAMKTHRKIFS